MRSRLDAGRIGTVAFGLFLWLQLTSGSLARELAYAEPDARRLIVYSLPLVFLAVSALWPQALIALLLFPTSFGGVLIVSPPATSEALAQPVAFLLIAITLLAYVLCAGAWLRPSAEDPLLDVSRRPLRVHRDPWRQHRGTVVPRAILLVAVFCATAGALPLMPELVANVAASFGGSGSPLAVETGLVLCNLIVFFIWCFLAYSMFLAPALELESKVRRLETQMQAKLIRAAGFRRRVAFILTVLVALGLIASLLLLRYL